MISLNTNFLVSKANEMFTKMNSFFSNNNHKSSDNINYQMLLIYIVISIVVIYFLFGLLKGPIVIVIGIVVGWIAYKSFV